MEDFQREDLRYREIPSKQQEKETYYDHIWDFYPFTDMDIHILPTNPEYLYPNFFFFFK